MQRLLSSKILMIGALMLVFLVGLGFIGAIVHERQRHYQQVLSDIRRDNVNQQTALTPFIVVPMTTKYLCADDSKKTCYQRQLVVISPEQARWHNGLVVDNQRFRRGIYSAISYQNEILINGHFRIPPELLTPADNQWLDWEQAQMRFYLSDLRGLQGQPELTIAQKKFGFSFPKEEGQNPLKLAYSAVTLGHVLPQNPTFDFSLRVNVAGTGSFQGLALGNDLSMTMSANWPHPSFFGESLPSKQITAKGFESAWQNTYLANRNTQLLTGCMANNPDACNELATAFKRQPQLGNYASEASTGSGAGGYGVNFIQAVDMYLMTERAMKYAALFLVITFGAFFLFEILKGLAIHPMQYALVGAALAVFYMLLLSFSEHMSFATAYAISSGACIGLISFYVSYVLQSVVRSLFFGGVLAMMYGAMFVILQSEDMTLIMGAVLVFALIAIMMFLTRHVDWYKLGASSTVDGQDNS